MFTELNEPIFYLAGHNWPLIDWGIGLPEKLTQDWLAGRGGDPDARIAALPVMCNVPTEFSYDPIMENIDLSRFDLVILSDIEYHSIAEITKWIEHNGIKNYLLSVGGLHAGETLDPSTTIYRPWWMYNLLKFNTFQPISPGPRPYMFELLLGARRPHRDFALMGLDKIGQLENSIATYRDIFVGGYQDSFSVQFARHFGDIKLRYPYVSPTLDPAWETQSDIRSNNISPFVPWEIYRRTNYSIVCETLGVSETFFLSEKTTKALWGKRIFVVFSSANFLKNLRDQGFKTFGSIIDERYDDEPNPLIRFNRVVEQMRYLSTQDPVTLYNQVQPVLDHNHQRVLGLRDETRQRMQALLQSKLS